MTLQLWEADCQPQCGFIVWSHNRDEVAEHLRLHVDLVHQTKMDKKKALTAVKSAAEAKTAKF